MTRKRNDHYDRDAVLDDLRDGLPYAQIMFRHDIARQTVSRLAIKHGLRRNPGGPNKGPEVACNGCGDRTWSPLGLCPPCQIELGGAADEALAGGAWVLDPRRRIQVWEAAS